MNIGEKIKKARIDKKVSQRELGSKLNMTGQAISKIELGDSSPSIDTLKSICKELGINLVSLIDNTVLSTTAGTNYISNKLKALILLMFVVLGFFYYRLYYRL